MAACKISLVQITSPFSGLGDFHHDHLGTVMVGTCLSGRFHTFWVLLSTNPHFCHTHFAIAGVCAAGHMLEVIVIEKIPATTSAPIYKLKELLAHTGSDCSLPICASHY